MINIINNYDNIDQNYTYLAFLPFFHTPLVGTILYLGCGIVGPKKYYKNAMKLIILSPNLLSKDEKQTQGTGKL